VEIRIVAEGCHNSFAEDKVTSQNESPARPERDELGSQIKKIAVIDDIAVWGGYRRRSVRARRPILQRSEHDFEHST
jgi:hypothetical protein